MYRGEHCVLARQRLFCRPALCAVSSFLVTESECVWLWGVEDNLGLLVKFG